MSFNEDVDDNDPTEENLALDASVIIDGRVDQGPEWQARVAAYELKYGYGNSYQMAEIYADSGDLDKTFEWLGHTARVKDPGGPWAMVMQFFEEARQDPRWADYVAEFRL